MRGDLICHDGCMTRPPLLPEADLDDMLARHPEWDLVDGKLRREVRLSSFADALGFMVRLGVEFDKLDHHPQWCNVYDRVTIEFVTHDVGGITELDVAAAQLVDTVLQTRRSEVDFG